MCVFFGALGMEAALERILGAPKPAETAHVDVKARLQLAGLGQFVDFPQLWPPTLAVRVWRVRVVCVACRRP